MSSELIFDYQSKRDRDPQSQKTITILRLAGLFFILSGAASLYLTWDNLFSFELYLYSAQILAGLLQLIYPQFSANSFSFTNKTISIDNNVISWKLGLREAMQSIEISSIKNIEVYFGEVHFKMISGENHKLKKHEIRNKSKFEKFNQIIEEMKKQRT